MPAPSHIFTNLVGPVPQHVGSELGWFNCEVHATSRTPACVALTQEALLAGGGNRIDPGCSRDLYGNGVWIAGPKDGGAAMVTVEQRLAPSFAAFDLLGQLGAISSVKGMPPRALAPNQWHTIASNIVGMIGWVMRAEGGTVYVDSHANLSIPPDKATDTGAGWQIEPGGFLVCPGNQNQYAWTFEPGVVLHQVKITRGAYFVKNPAVT